MVRDGLKGEDLILNAIIDLLKYPWNSLIRTLPRKEDLKINQRETKTSTEIIKETKEITTSGKMTTIMSKMIKNSEGTLRLIEDIEVSSKTTEAIEELLKMIEATEIIKIKAIENIRITGTIIGKNSHIPREEVEVSLSKGSLIETEIGLQIEDKAIKDSLNKDKIKIIEVEVSQEEEQHVEEAGVEIITAKTKKGKFNDNNLNNLNNHNHNRNQNQNQPLCRWSKANLLVKKNNDSSHKSRHKMMLNLFVRMKKW